LIKKSGNDDLTILSNFQLSQNILRYELENQTITKESEHDFIVIVKNRGVVLFEVKSSLSSRSGAVTQLKKIERFTTELSHLCGISDLPIVKVACFPNSDKEECGIKGKLVTLTANAFNLQNESDNAVRKWTDIGTMQHAWDLINPMLTSRLYKNEIDKFDRFQKIFVGVWSNGNLEQASLTWHFDRIDERLSTANLSQGNKGEVMSDGIERPDKKERKSIFDRLEVKYLTKEQKEVFEDPEYKHCIIKGINIS